MTQTGPQTPQNSLAFSVRVPWLFVVFFLLARRRFIFRRALGLNLVGDESAVWRQPSLDQGLTVIHKCIGQRVASRVADRERLPFPFDHEVHPPGVSRDRAGANRTAHAHAMVRLGTLRRREFRNGVIVGLTLFRAYPGEPAQRDDYDECAHHEFGLFVHGPSSRTLILRPWSLPAGAGSGRQAARSHSGGQSVTVRVTDTFTCVPGAVIFIVPLYTPGPSPTAFTSTIGL